MRYRRLPARGTAWRETLDRRVFDQLREEYGVTKNYRGLALLNVLYRESYPQWPEFQGEQKVAAP